MKLNLEEWDESPTDDWDRHNVEHAPCGQGFGLEDTEMMIDYLRRLWDHQEHC